MAPWQMEPKTKTRITPLFYFEPYPCGFVSLRAQFLGLVLGIKEKTPILDGREKPVLAWEGRGPMAHSRSLNMSRQKETLLKVMVCWVWKVC